MSMTPDLEFTGERYLPGTPGEIAHEHWHRYAFARRYVGGRRVLDVACGEGYGSALLATVAARVTGVDIDAVTLAHAVATYGDRGNLNFVEGSASRLPLDNGSVDAIVSFETIEHLEAQEQPRMLAEFARVLAPGGFLLVSSPNRPEYSEARNHVNPYHLHELDRGELARLLDVDFPAQRWHRQRRYIGSALWTESPSESIGAAPDVHLDALASTAPVGSYEALSGTAASARAGALPPAMYFVVFAARTPDALPAQSIALSLFTDDGDAEWTRIDREAREVLRLDTLLVAANAGIVELREIVAYRDQSIARLEARLTEANAALERLSRQIDAQERLIAYRESLGWWTALPWLRIRRLWNRIRTE